MKGIEKGRKKRNPKPLRLGHKEKLGKRKDLYTQVTHHFLQHGHITFKWYTRGLLVLLFKIYFSFLHV